MTTKEWLSKIWCCLNPAERNAFKLVSAQATIALPFIFKVLYDGYWIAVGVPSASIRSEIFVSSYKMTLGNFPPVGEESVEVYYLDIVFWLEVQGFVDDPENECTKKCRLLTYPL